jgi:hypothetical protein
MMRPARSIEPPGAVGTTILTVRSGKPCAEADEARAASIAATPSVATAPSVLVRNPIILILPGAAFCYAVAMAC